MFKWLNPWKALRDRKEAQRIEADRIATANALEQHERAAKILAATIERSRKPTLRAVAPLSAQQAVANERTEWQASEDRKALDRLRARQRVEEDESRRQRNSTSDAENSFMTAAYLSSLGGSTEAAKTERVSGGGGTFDGAGASGNWSYDSGSRSSSSSSSDSGSSSSSSSSDSSSSSSSDSGGGGSCGGGGD